ncbi:MAG: adenylate kinase [Bacteroidetes bacterium]|nr:adenylate kinase [Bacteroidota bacterium]
MLNLVLFGPPGAGKGTQSERLMQRYGLVHLSTGDIFRHHLKQETELGKLAKTYIDQGHLVPDTVTVSMLKSAVLEQNSPNGFIFDGFPRTTPQAAALDGLLLELNTDITLMLGLEVEEEELKMRLKNRATASGRSDDADPQIIANRIAVYNRETAPVKDFYAAQQKFVAIDGTGSLDSVTERLFAAIDSRT